MFNTPEFQALRREYIQGALERCDYLREQARQIRQDDPRVDLQRLRQEIHKFRGSGGFYGFAGLSQASAVAEDQLIQVLEGEAPRENEALAQLVEAVVVAAETAAQGLQTSQ